MRCNNDKFRSISPGSVLIQPDTKKGVIKMTKDCGKVYAAQQHLAHVVLTSLP